MKLGFPRRRVAFCLSVYFATLSDRLRPSGFLHDLLLNRCSVVLRSLFFVVAMFGRKLYKTKLCLLFQRGRCPRQSCNFAHGEAELRRFSGSFSGRRDLRSADLRDKLDRRYSPHRRVSPGRVPRAQHSFRYQKPISRDRGSSLSRSPIRRSDRRHRKKHRTDGESDFSESFKASDGSEERKKEDKVPSYDDKDDLEEQLRQLQLDIEMLDDHKSQLESLLDEKINEAHKLSTRMEDLESQLNKEQEDYKRITSKIKKFIRAHGRYIKAQEELKRSQTRLQKIGDQFSSDTLKLNAYEDDPSANIISDGDPNADGNSRKRERDFEAPFRSEKSQRSERPAPMSETTIKRIETMKAILKRNTSQVEDYNHKQGRNASSIGSLDKGKGLEVRHSLPLTGMAAHAIDELLEANEFDEKHEAAETFAVNETDDADRSTKSTCIPPPPQATQNAYKQYQGDDDEIDVEKVDSEMLDIDINSEVDIEQV
ncbi:zinc finger CCCH domain-containing protein 13-like isoform X3 [Zingiber officinale]|uniref:zinc finger CCCH domain-containing protein 13-like isoform X3 n=1 Tax=Zingiber officinale TaxID=94328 RepID=UPI001C4CC005|nr:zinc finger CCCH domain-containing protein 13-like isoform X3 [Zingiber officinale]